MKPSSQAAAWLGCAAVALLAVSACGDDSGSDEQTATAAGRAGAPAAGATNGGASSKGGSSASDDAGAGNVDAGGSEPGAAGEASTPSGGTNSGNMAGAPSAAGAGIGEPPGPAPGGGSVYAVECSGDTAMCGVERSHCLGISVGDGKVGYSCSNHCNTVDDCSDAPSGAEAEVGCVQFKQEKRCVLVCYSQPNEYACPDGMSCYIYPNSPIGYCLWMK